MTTRKKNILDKIGSLIPGYSGYADRSNRRNSEKIFRVQNALVLDEIEKKLIDFQKKLLANNEIEKLKDLESIRKYLNTTISKFKNASYGESSFFATHQIKEEELLEILKFDEEVADKIQHLRKQIKSDEILNTDFSGIKNLISEVESILIQRFSYISKYK